MLTYDDNKHEYRFNDVLVPSVTQALVESGIVDVSWFTEEGRLRGNDVHLAANLYDNGDLDESTVRDEIKGYLDAYKRFLEESGFVFIESERIVWNPTYRYAGRFDRIGSLNRRPTIIDIKTGAVEAWAGLQLAAYAACFNGREFDRYALQLKSDGTYRLHQFKDRNDIKTFIAALAIANWKRAH